MDTIFRFRRRVLVVERLVWCLWGIRYLLGIALSIGNYYERVRRRFFFSLYLFLGSSEGVIFVIVRYFLRGSNDIVMSVAIVGIFLV